MKKWLIILILVIVIIAIAILLTNLPFDISHNTNVSYEQIDVQMKKTWY
ncbi:MAG: hypothetical protein IJQ68_07950 [Methanobrevibacter sp.]|nr:hypothetical protein [Methanobrevibacter sp.]MBR0271901.1 hypothetical protein [Methanobrevibacter sp.]